MHCMQLSAGATEGRVGPTEAENGIALRTGSLFHGEPAGFLAGAGCQDPLSARSRTLGPGVRRVCLQGPGDRHATSSGGGAGSPSLQLPPVLALERACFSAPSWAAFSAGSAFLSSNSFVTSPVRISSRGPKGGHWRQDTDPIAHQAAAP